jgi:DNA repair protein RadC
MSLVSAKGDTKRPHRWYSLIRRFARQNRNSPVEVLCAIYLEREKVLLMEMTEQGRPDRVTFPIRKIVSTALDMSCTSIVLAHNHPSGQLRPSRDDLAQTRSLARAILPLGIHLEDHFIVAGDRVSSLREQGLC